MPVSTRGQLRPHMQDDNGDDERDEQQRQRARITPQRQCQEQQRRQPAAAAPSKSGDELTAPRWPRGALPVVVAAVYIGMMVVANVPAARALPGLQQLWALSLWTWGSAHRVRVLMAAAAGVHMLEAAYAVALCVRAGLPGEQAAGHASLTLLLGVAALMPLRAALRKRQQLRAK